MPDGLLLSGAGLVSLVVFAAILVRADRRTDHRIPDPGWSGWLLLVLGVLCVAAGAALFWSQLFSR